MAFQPNDPNFGERVRASFARQRAMQTLGIEIVRLEPGEIELAMPYDCAYTQQHGFTHAGIVATALDSACGYAAFSLMPAEAAVLTVEQDQPSRARRRRAVFVSCACRKDWPRADFLRGCGACSERRRRRAAHSNDDRHAHGAL
jgi:hypothetical protein